MLLVTYRSGKLKPRSEDSSIHKQAMSVCTSTKSDLKPRFDLNETRDLETWCMRCELSQDGMFEWASVLPSGNGARWLHILWTLYTINL